MSSLLQAPPSRIQIGGPTPDGPGGPSPDGQDDTSGSPTDLLRRALALVTKAADAEPDDADTAGIHKIAADLAKAIAVEQQTQDAVSGAGPGVKMLRKAQPSGGPA